MNAWQDPKYAPVFPDKYVLSDDILFVNPLSANPTKRSNTLKQFVDDSRQIV